MRIRVRGAGVIRRSGVGMGDERASRDRGIEGRHISLETSGTIKALSLIWDTQ